MILVGSQRGHAHELAVHLMKDENEHIEIFEIKGFVSDDLAGAFDEARAASRGTRCQQYLFSLSLNPPADANVPTPGFLSAIDRIEDRLGLSGQPRAIVFHEKQGRRHAHAVWSRIRADDMKAVQLSFTRRKLMSMARELYLEHGWKMPRGLVASEERDPRSFTLVEWQQSKRAAKDATAIKADLQDAWAISDNRAAFEHSLETRGYRLARGDRRGFVAVDNQGEVYALARWIGVKTKHVRARLGDEDQLPSVLEVSEEIAADIRSALTRLKAELLAETKARNNDLRIRRAALVLRQRLARQKLEREIETRKWAEARARQARFRRGLKGIWDRIRGEHRYIRELNEREARAAAVRDRAQLDCLVFDQLAERTRLADLRNELARLFSQNRSDLLADAAHARELAPPRRSPHQRPQSRRTIA